MLLSFGARNFGSIAERQQIDLTVSERATDPRRHFAKRESGRRAVKVAALLGANASGKTNLLKVPSFLTWLLADSFDMKPEGEILITPFYGGDWPDKPTEMFVEFDGFLDKQYVEATYEVSLTTKAILFEALHIKQKGFGYFVRQGRSLKTSGKFRLSPKDPVRDKIRDNASVISTLAQFNHALAKNVVYGAGLLITNVAWSGKYEWSNQYLAAKYYSEDESRLTRLNEFLRQADLGIDHVEITSIDVSKEGASEQQETEKRKIAKFYHHALSRPLPFELESHGTKELFKMLPRLFLAIDNGGVAAIDELDLDLHPVLLQRLLDLFHDESINTKGAQLIFAGHNPYALATLEKDEIFFVEKDKSGATEVFGLRDVQGVRRSENFAARYLSGRYGGVPNV